MRTRPLRSRSNRDEPGSGISTINFKGSTELEGIANGPASRICNWTLGTSGRQSTACDSRTSRLFSLPMPGRLLALEGPVHDAPNSVPGRLAVMQNRANLFNNWEFYSGLARKSQDGPGRAHAFGDHFHSLEDVA